jgi:hypothetical protein
MIFETAVLARKSFLKKSASTLILKVNITFQPPNFVLKGESLNTTLKVSSVISSQSFLVIDNTSMLGLNKGSLCGLENLFQDKRLDKCHNQTPSPQTSFHLLRNILFNSIVK